MERTIGEEGRDTGAAGHEQARPALLAREEGAVPRTEPHPVTDLGLATEESFY
jgi:hypothetical protein